ncbi:MAG: hypothetical protein Q9174_004691 [Haloplaca sp. 1 TL-2023]
MTRPPELPRGSAGIFSGLSETFSFHASPESFITSRVLAFQKQNPALAQTRTPIHAKVLNRNVAVISSHDHVRQALCDEGITTKLSAGAAYDELIAPFFPQPNVLLLDPPEHQQSKQIWVHRMQKVEGSIRSKVPNIVLDHFSHIQSGSRVDLYDSMKTLSRKILLSIFLSTDEDQESDSADLENIEVLHEELLRGQFSLFPISVQTPFWRSPRAKGLDARRELESLLAAGVGQGRCPFATGTDAEKHDVASHLLLFTSSLATKALASLLTALVMNVYVYKRSDSDDSLGDQIRAMDDREGKCEMLRSVILETERLSPPVVGIMRRTIQDTILTPPDQSTAPTLIPKGWDTWIYFVGAGRDPARFGHTAETYRPARYTGPEAVDATPPEGFAFGAGAKACLGRNVTRLIATAVIEACLGLESRRILQAFTRTPRINIVGDACQMPSGVRAWLGWQQDVAPEQWAKDMKQLPTQRPRKPVYVQVRR